MNFFWQKEKREVAQSSENFLEYFGIDQTSAAGVNVGIENALGVPAVWAAVQFLSGTLAGLPVHVYRKTSEGRVRVKGPINNILHDAPNEEMSSFEWRKYMFEQVFTGGRGITFIERNKAGRVMNLWPLDPTKVTIKRVSGKKIYEYKEENKKPSPWIPCSKKAR